MKKLFCMAFALTMAFVASAQQLPDVRVENAEGKTISTRELIGGKPLIISFWSLACKPCIQELNAINDQLDEWREQVRLRGNRRIGGRCAHEGGRQGQIPLLRLGLHLHLRREPDPEAGHERVAYPQSFVLDKEGRIVFSHSGYTPGSEQLLLDKILELNK